MFSLSHELFMTEHYTITLKVPPNWLYKYRELIPLNMEIYLCVQSFFKQLNTIVGVFYLYDGVI